ncbi:hypothetical protein KPH14_000992 [Odynerus spinipes]|uniref:Uncharacterized protein n=1 Tax=Odynerus spinipes TaxID=1348599 RepID=A0AAD9VL36_9HYME|nr:hypothetical protein KPH14_000992 [Odynerus spinipes]
MFGTPVKVGLKTSSFPNDSVDHFRTEEELQTLINTVNNASENTNSEIEDDSDANNNDSSQNDPSPEVKFETQKDDEAVVPLIQTDILSRQE